MITDLGYPILVLWEVGSTLQNSLGQGLARVGLEISRCQQAERIFSE